jgi:hypothetical protein
LPHWGSGIDASGPGAIHRSNASHPRTASG